MPTRDDFTATTKRTIAERVAYMCSNPDCRAQTTGPTEDPGRRVNVGVAAHITAASVGGPRYDDGLTPGDRAAPENGIWLCQSCAKMVDDDPVRYTVALLRDWKRNAETQADESVGKPSPQMSAQIGDKWVNLEYPEQASISAALRDRGFKLYWCGANREAMRVDLEGWEYVLVDEPDGSRARLKVKDHSVGGYLVLLRKLLNSVS